MSRWAGEWGVQLGVGPRCWDKRKCCSAPDLPLKSPGLCGFLAQDVSPYSGLQTFERPRPGPTVCLPAGSQPSSSPFVAAGLTGIWDRPWKKVVRAGTSSGDSLAEGDVWREASAVRRWDLPSVPDACSFCWPTWEGAVSDIAVLPAVAAHVSSPHEHRHVRHPHDWCRFASM